MSIVDLSLTLFLAEIIGFAGLVFGAAPIAGKNQRPTSIKASQITLILLQLFAALPSGIAIPGQTYPGRMQSLKYSIPSPPIPTKFPLKSPRGANLATRIWPVKDPLALCLFVHGGGWHSGYFQDLASFLNKDGIYCASYDQVNCGYSDPEPDTPAPGVIHVRNFDCYIEDVCASVEWMQKEAGNTAVPVFLFGESFGALEVGR
jgi:acetyl esterase/lipase